MRQEIEEVLAGIEIGEGAVESFNFRDMSDDELNQIAQRLAALKTDSQAEELRRWSDKERDGGRPESELKYRNFILGTRPNGTAAKSIAELERLDREEAQGTISSDGLCEALFYEFVFAIIVTGRDIDLGGGMLRANPDFPDCTKAASEMR